MKYVQCRIRRWVRCAALLVFAVASIPVTYAGIRRVEGGVWIEYSSGFPGGVVRTPVINPIPPQGFFFRRFDNRPFTYGVSRGGTGLRVLLSPDRNHYLFFVPTNSYLVQHRRFCTAPPFGGSTPAAYIHIHFDVHLPTDAAGLPGGLFQIAYPLSVGNDPGFGSFSVLQAAFRIAINTPMGGHRELGTAIMQANFPFPSQTFTGIVPRPGIDAYRPIAVPDLPGNSTLDVWGDIIFRTRGCPAAGADAQEIEALEGASDTMGDDTDPLDWTYPDDPYDPNVDYFPVDPDFIMDMNPFLEIDNIPQEGELDAMDTGIHNKGPVSNATIQGPRSLPPRWQ